ncbi:MAG: hypothetical protein EA340_08475 [Nitriliruptor sp.]|nr:MAG: hypothetical protein EA340_08475 [Nitriliruptor sp.]
MAPPGRSPPPGAPGVGGPGRRRPGARVGRRGAGRAGRPGGARRPRPARTRPGTARRALARRPAPVHGGPPRQAGPDPAPVGAGPAGGPPRRRQLRRGGVVRAGRRCGPARERRPLAARPATDRGSHAVNLPLTTVLVRHAWAGERGTVPDDRNRPLDERGRRQADALLAHLDLALDARGLRPLAGDPSGVVLVSSPLVRCVATLEPMAEELGVVVTPDDRLAELAVPLHSTDGWPDAAYLGTRALAALADAAERSPADGALVLCAHGEVLPALIAALAGEGRLSSPVSVDLTAKRLPKGASWLLVPAAGGDEPGGSRSVQELAPPA